MDYLLKPLKQRILFFDIVLLLNLAMFPILCKGVELPIVKTLSPDDTTEQMARMNGQVVSDGGEVCESRFRFKRLIDPSYQYTDWIEWPWNVTGENFGHTLIFRPDTNSGSTYYYNAQLKNSAGESNWGTEESFIMKGTLPPPQIHIISAFDINETSAWLKGSLWADGDEFCQYKFRYKKSGEVSYIEKEWTGSVIRMQEFTEYIGDLSPDTMYNYSVQVKNSDVTSEWSDDKSFKTKEVSVTPQIDIPVVTTLHTENKTNKSVTLYGQIENDGDEACTYRITIREDGGSEIQTEWFCCKSTGDIFSLYFDGLSSETKYYYYAQAKNSAGISNGDEKDFFTLADSNVPPDSNDPNNIPPDLPDYIRWINVTTLEPENLTETSVTLRGRLDDDKGRETCEYMFQLTDYDAYQIDPNNYDEWIFPTMDLRCCASEGQIFSETVNGLKPGTNYEYMAIVVGGYDTNEGLFYYGYGSPVFFKTKGDDNLLLNPPNLISPDNNTSGVSINPTFEWGEIEGADYYGLYISKGIDEEKEIVFDSDNFHRKITGTTFQLPEGVLKPGITYQWDMRTHNKTGWGPFCENYTFTTKQQFACYLYAELTSGKVPLNVEFTLEAYDIPENSIYDFEFDPGDESNDFQNISPAEFPLTLYHTYENPGRYSAILTVWDDNSDSITDEAVINIASICVPDDYAALQDAINASVSGDVIVVYEGVYSTSSVLTVPEDVILIFEPGCVVKFDQLGRLEVYGCMYAKDTIFTSIKDDDYGKDTNGDGDATSPAPEDWVNIHLFPSCTECILENCVVQYAGRFGTFGAITSLGPKLTVSNCVISQNFMDGIYIEGGCKIQNNVITFNGSNGIRIYNRSINSDVIIKENVIENHFCGIYLENSKGATIWCNDLMNYVYNAYSKNSECIWNSPKLITYKYNNQTYTNFLGNFWHGYDGPDNDKFENNVGDGIIDNPYDYHNGFIDKFPLKSHFKEYGTKPDRNFSFTHITDTHIGYIGSLSEEDYLDKTITEINNSSSDFVLVTGDIVDYACSDIDYICSSNNFNIFKNCMNSLNKVYYVVPGNHDRAMPPDTFYHLCSNGLSCYLEHFNDSTYFVYKGLLFIGLDTGSDHDYGELSSEMEDFLNNLVLEYPTLPKVIFMHHPLGDIDDDFRILCKEKNVLVVIAGHTHQDLVFGTGPIYVQTPSCTVRHTWVGADDPQGYRIIEVKGGEVIVNPVKSVEDTLSNMAIITP